MGTGKFKGKAGRYFAGILMLLFVFCIPAAAAGKEGANEYEIYPTPQAAVYESGTTVLTEEVDVTFGTGIDSYTEKKTETALDILGLSPASAAGAQHTKLVVGIFGSSDVASYEEALGAEAFFTGEVDGLTARQRFDKYILKISDGQIVILGEDTDAAFRGVTTLQRILEQVSKTDKSVKKLTIKDYAEIEFRGFIEGYYGNPWSHEDRKDLMQYGGQIKMNQYVFAPKDDPYHRTQWRDLYPETGEKNSLVQIRDLAKAGNENKCYYVYALHPFYSNKITLENYDADIAVLKAKFEQVIDAGVRQIAILEDDGSAHSDWQTASEILVKVLNDISAWLEEKQQSSPEFSDLKTELLFCPGFMAYANNMTDSNNEDVKKIQEVHSKVGENVRIVMTGGKIWGDVTTDFADRFYNKTNEKKEPGRYPYLWVNWPCNDNTHDSLVMGGHNSILKPNLDGYKYHGIIFNPMQDSEPSKVGLFTGADYCWNVWRGENAQAQGDQAWEDSFKYIDHMTAEETDASESLRGICQHMITQSDRQANNTGVKFEESLNIKDDLLAIQEKVETGSELTAQEISLIKTELTAIKEDIKYYIKDKNGANQRMAAQLTPYASCLSDIAEAGVYLMQAIESVQNGNDSDVYDNFAKAQELYEKSNTYTFVDPDGTQYAKGGRRYIIPFVESVLEYVSDEAAKVVDPENTPLKKKLIAQVGGSKINTSANQAQTMDGDLSTYYEIQVQQKSGDYVGLSFNMPVAVQNIQIALASSSGIKNFIYEGIMEYTLDGSTWTAFEEEVQPDSHIGENVKMELPTAMEIRGFRWKCVSTNDVDRWLTIREIGYNIDGEIGAGKPTAGEKYQATFSKPSGWSVHEGPETNMTDDDLSSQVWFNPGNGDTSVAGDYIQLDLGAVKPVGRVRAVVGGLKNNAPSDDKWTKYHVEYSETGEAGSWTAMPSYTDSVTGPYTYEINLKGAAARYIRLVNEVNVHKWVMFCDFSAFTYVYEPEGEAMDYTNTADTEDGWRVEYGEESAKIFPKEEAVLQPNEYIGLKLDRIHAVASIQTEGTGMESLTLEKSVNESEWTKAVKGSARYIRLINNTNTAVTFRLTSFEVALDEMQPIHFEEASREPEGAYVSQDARNMGTTGNWFDGDKNSAAKYCFEADTGDYITYDLGQEVNLHTVRVWVANNAMDYPRKAEVQAALTPDSAEWTTLVSVDGNGSADAFSTTPINNGWNAGEGAIDVNYAYIGGELEQTVKARYLRIYCTGRNAGRYIELSEIEINNNEYLPSVNDPTFELTGNVTLQRGMEPQNLNDHNLTSAFRPVGSSSGALVYNLSEGTKNINKINILQNGNNISNAKVSVRTEANQWEEIGSLTKGFSSFDITLKKEIYAVKVEWEQTELALYEIVVLHGDQPELKKYTVTFNSNGGSNVEPKKVEEGEKLTGVEPQREGYAFAGWFTDEGCTKAFDFTKPITGDITLHAKWTKLQEYTVTFDYKDGSQVRTEKVYEGKKVTKPEDPNREGYTFAGWFTDEAYTVPYDFSEKITGNITLYAKWTQPQEYTVTFDYKDGSQTKSEKVKEGNAVAKPEDPKRESYIFGGWFTDEACTAAYDFTGKVTGDITLYAKWTKVPEFTVTFDYKDGSQTKTENVEEGKTVTRPEDPKREGYTFGGWYADESCQTAYDFAAPVTGNITVYAKWNSNTNEGPFKVTFDSNSGTAVPEQSIAKDQTADEPKAPTRNGYRFAGWYDKNGSKFDFAATKITEDITLTAKWIRVYTVTFDSKGGSKVASQTVDEGGVIKSVTSKKAGYQFAGWYTDSACTKKFSATTKIAKNTKLYAKWTPVLPRTGEKKTIGNLIYKVTKSHATKGTVSVAGISKKEKTKIKIPSTVKIGKVTFKVTAIESKAFTKAKKLKSVEIGANIKKINAKAFYKVKTLKTITFKTSKTPKFGSKVFTGTNAKSKVVAPKKMSKKEFKKFKTSCKKAGVSKKAAYKQK